MSIFWKIVFRLPERMKINCFIELKIFVCFSFKTSRLYFSFPPPKEIQQGVDFLNIRIHYHPWITLKHLPVVSGKMQSWLQSLAVVFVYACFKNDCSCFISSSLYTLQKVAHLLPSSFIFVLAAGIMRPCFLWTSYAFWMSTLSHFPTTKLFLFYGKKCFSHCPVASPPPGFSQNQTPVMVLNNNSQFAEIE